MHSSKKQEYRIWILFVITIFLIISASISIYNRQVEKELSYLENQSESEIELVSTLIQERLQKHEYQLAETFIKNWAGNNPDIIDIRLVTHKGFVIAKHSNPVDTFHSIVKKSNISYSYNGQAELKIAKDTSPVYESHHRLLIKLTAGISLISLILFILAYSNIQTTRQKHDLALENARRRETEKSYLKEKVKAEQAANFAQQNAEEKDRINKDLEKEISIRLKIEEDLNNLNDTLEEKVNERTSELKDLNEKIGDIARSAGMAEVATGVLHNIGNVMNSINVSATVLLEFTKNTKASNIERISSMLNENINNIGEYLTHDDKGKHIPEFITALSEHLSKEKENNIKELTYMLHNLDHIKKVISMQQSYAGNYGINEQVNLSELVEDAININMNGIKRNSITIKRNYDISPSIYIDRHKTLQILINLISNAKHALIEHQSDEKLLQLSIEKGTDDISIEVQDNGVGIDSEDLPQLFQYGFKKRRDGHGFGLHNSALVATDLNARITVHSDGLGKGAIFKLIINTSADTNS